MSFRSLFYLFLSGRFTQLYFMCVTLCPFLFCIHLDGEERAGCFTLFVFLVSRDCCVALPHNVMGLSADCDCGISLSYSLTIFREIFTCI